MRLARLVPVVASGLALIAVAACSESQSSATPAPPAPTAVSVVKVKPEPLPIISDLPGRIAPTRIAEVRPRVTGIVLKRVFEQGSLVKEGDVLYKIDPAQFRVQVESAQATLQRAIAAQTLARQQSDRQKELRQRNISSAQDLDSALAQLAQADADVASARANLDAAKLNLQYSDVTAPIGGRIGSALITEGALVSGNGTENLATIQQLDPVYADFTQPSEEMRRLRKALKDGLLKSPGNGQATVKLLFDDGSEYPQTGRLLFSESTVDQTTGQITMRAEFPNPDGDLLPGMYVRVLIEQAVDQAALTVPQQAVQHDSGGNSQLYVVNDKNIVDLRTVTTGRTTGQQVVVAKGLKSGEQVVVEGFQKIHPGATVKPEEWKSADDKLSSTQSKADAG